MIERLAAALLGAVATVRSIAAGPLTARAVGAAACAVALLATTAPGWDAPDGYVVVGVLAACGFALGPDSGTGTVFVGAVVVTWLAGAPGRVDAAVVVTAVALVVAHVAGATAASMPVTGRADLAAVARWWRPAVAVAAAVPPVGWLVAVLDAGSRPGSLAVTLGVLALAGALAWRWSSPEDAQSRLRTAHRSGNTGENSVERR